MVQSRYIATANVVWDVLDDSLGRKEGHEEKWEGP